jgi:hypothetical protein
MDEHKCKSCGTTQSNEWHGEEVSFMGFKRWNWYCKSCKYKSFVSMVNSSPELQNRYKAIYGKSVEEVINDLPN